jgi:DNA-binding NtrC family response regulator
METSPDLKYNDIKAQIGFYGSSADTEEIIRIVTTIAPTDISVLIVGESGTGKELVARAIHRLSKRADQPLISVNTGAIPEGILESELFGHEKGSFTGAVGQRKGYFESANRGTIFLDEIGEMSLNTQVKLLRVLEENEFMRVGGTQTQKVDVRIIAATNKNLELAVKNNEFRQDLYFRLKAIKIDVPPLRRRKTDIPVLVKKFAADFCASQNIRFKGFSPDAVQKMQEYDWPGNIRELKNFVETAIIINKGEVINSAYVLANLSLYQDEGSSKNLPVPLNMSPERAEREIIYRTLLSLKLDIAEIKKIVMAMQPGSDGEQAYEIPQDPEVIAYEDKNELKPTTLANMERELIKQTLKDFEGSRRKTARALQISERTLYRKIKEYGL